MSFVMTASNLSQNANNRRRDTTDQAYNQVHTVDNLKHVGFSLHARFVTVIDGTGGCLNERLT
jgi:hypothetical protein